VTDKSGNRKKRIGLFGGTLDPIHLGHLRAAEEVREWLCLDEIWFMPAFRPPHKDTNTLTSFHHRLKMVELAVEDVDSFKASDIEGKRPGPSYSVDTLTDIRKAKGQHLDLFFIVGSDAFLEIDTWKEYARLPLLAELVVITRPPCEMGDLEDGLKRLFPEYQKDPGGKGLFVSAAGGRIRLVRTTWIEISSTDIRKRARTGLSVRFLVPEKVRRYMATNNLYISIKSEGLLDAQADPALEIVKKIFAQIRNNKGEDICILDMRGISPVADFFIIAQGRSTRHVQGMASKMRRDLSRLKIKCRNIEGADEGKWVLLDFDDIIVHLFYEPVRSFYDLEGLWAEAPRLSLEENIQALEEING